ncbi:MAG: AzlD domain-containing protein [Clostridia bacterium]|nr:AzlD domain-containing protein [Clostridia bacterium]
MRGNIYIYIAIMALVTYLIRVVPLTLIRKQIKNKYLKSFLYYVPYVTLAVMTFPAILHATQSIYSGLLALIIGVVVAWFGFDLFKTAVSCCLIVLILEFFIV